MDDHRLAASLAERTGSLLRSLRDQKPGDGALGRLADRAAHDFLASELAKARPDDWVLSEECPDDPSRLRRSRVWIVDPLDGTREYAEERPDWAVHVALTVNGIPIAGAVAQPDLDRLASTAVPRPRSSAANVPVVVVSRTRPSPRSAMLSHALGGDLRKLGSAGAKTMAVLTDEADLYFHEGGQYEWDNCAPVAVALASGLRACRIDGSPIRYNRTDLQVPDLLIGLPDLVEKAIAILAAH